LKSSDAFIYRHIGNGEHNTSKALEAIGVESMDQLLDQVVPSDIRLPPALAFKHNGKELKGVDSEKLMLQRMRQLM